MRRRLTRRFVFLLLALCAVLLYRAGFALAHVTVDPDTARVGSETVFTFRVPNEQDTARTVQIELALPTTTPIPSALVRPLPGWTAHITKVKLAKAVQTDDGPIGQVVSRITWTADGKSNAIAPGQFQEFTVEAGPLPKTKVLLFKVLQRYSDGTVVRWIDPPSTGEQLPHPAPAVSLDDAATPRPDVSTSAAASGDSASAGGDRWIAVAAFVAGLLGLAAGTSALVRVRRGGDEGSHGADRE